MNSTTFRQRLNDFAANLPTWLWLLFLAWVLAWMAVEGRRLGK